MSDLSPGERELIERIHWLVSQRWLAIAGVGGATALFQLFGPLPLPYGALYTTASAMALYNAAFSLFARHRGISTQGAWVFANLQIAVDLVVLTLLLHLTGGVENPFACYFVFHMIIASILLTPLATYLQATWATGLYGTMAHLEFHGILAHYHPIGLLPQELYRHLPFILLVVFCLATTLYLSVFMATSITRQLGRKEREIMALTGALDSRAQQLAEANERLAEADRAKSRYLRKVSHELRAPLSAIQSCLRVVLEGLTGEISSKGREMVERAEKRTWQLLEVLDALLLLSRSREGRLSIQWGWLSLSEVIAKGMGVWEIGASERGIRLETEVAPDLPPLWGDPEGMEQLLNNLIGNGIKYTPPGGTVRLEASAAEGTLRITISDSGIGIPPEAASKIFEEFYRTENARKFAREGNGLGLSIVKSIVEAHHGEIDLKSRPGEGTQFSLRFPLSPNAATIVVSANIVSANLCHFERSEKS